MKTILILTALLISGCAVIYGPMGEPPLNKYTIEINYYSDSQSLQKVCGLNTIGCAEVFVNPCKIHVLHRDWPTIKHEIKHCQFGLWHE